MKATLILAAALAAGTYDVELTQQGGAAPAPPGANDLWNHGAYARADPLVVGQPQTFPFTVPSGWTGDVEIIIGGDVAESGGARVTIYRDDSPTPIYGPGPATVLSMAGGGHRAVLEAVAAAIAPQTATRATLQLNHGD